jgi:hypothetical protein
MTQVSSAAPRLCRGRTTALLGILVVAILAIGSTTASALVIRLTNGKSVSVQLVPGKTPPKGALGNGPLEYHGGPVMSENINYAIFWVKPKDAFAAGFTSGVSTWFKAIAHDSGKNTNSDNILGQYGGPYISKFGEPLKSGSITDKDPYPANGCTAAPACLNEEQLEAEVRKVVESRGLPQDTHHEYFLFTAPNVENCFYPGEGFYCSASAEKYISYCAYHSAFSGSKGPIIWSNDPYVYLKLCDEAGHHPNGAGDSALLGGLSHEHSESVTDPEPNSGWTNKVGEEIGDICRTFEPASEFGAILGTAPDGSPYNYLVDKKRYFYQTEWSNSASACVQHA